MSTLRTHALRSTKVQARGSNAAGAFTIVLFALFAIALLLALVAGTGVYRHINAADEASSHERLSLSLVANAVRATDAADAVSQGAGPEGAALVLTEHLSTGAYETRFYLHDGWIVEEYTVAGAVYNPDGATPVAASETFAFDVADGLVRISCDEGETAVALRSDGAVAEGGE